MRLGSNLPSCCPSSRRVFLGLIPKRSPMSPQAFGSKSTKQTLSFVSIAVAIAKLTAKVDLPTPPLPPIIVRTCEFAMGNPLFLS